MRIRTVSVHTSSYATEHQVATTKHQQQQQELQQNYNHTSKRDDKNHGSIAETGGWLGGNSAFLPFGAILNLRKGSEC